MITKVGLLWVLENKLLAVYKKTINKYILPGGKLEPEETETACLMREIREELGDIVADGFKNEIEREGIRYYDEFGALIDAGVYLSIRCYLADEIRPDLKDKILHNPRDNITAHCWIDGNYEEQGLELAPILEFQILPRMRIIEKVKPFLRYNDPFDCYPGNSWLNPDSFCH